MFLPRLTLVICLLAVSGVARADMRVERESDGTVRLTNRKGPSPKARTAFDDDGALRVILRGGVQCTPRPDKGQYDGHFGEAAKLHRIPVDLLKAVAWAESAFDPGAVSRVGAQGLMQLMPATAGELGVSDPFDPAQAIEGGARYLRTLLDRFEGDLKLALAGYNAGPEAVERHGGIPPFEETQRYVARVLKWYRQRAGDEASLII